MTELELYEQAKAAKKFLEQCLDLLSDLSDAEEVDIKRAIRFINHSFLQL